METRQEMKSGLKRSESRRSLQSSLSMISQKKDELSQLFAKGFNCTQRLKLIAVSALPLIVVIGLCAQSTLKVLNDIQAIKNVQKAVRVSQTASEIMTGLIADRSQICEYFILNRTNVASQSAFTTTLNLVLLLASNTSRTYLELYNSLLGNSENVTCSDATRSYSSHIERILSEIASPFTAGQDGEFWSTIYAYNSILSAKEFTGLQRVYGVDFFGSGGFQWPLYVNYAKLTGRANALLQNVTSILSPASSKFYENLTLSNPKTINYISKETEVIFQNDRSSLHPDPVRGTSWFDNLTDYINLVTLVESGLTSSILNRLTTELQTRRLEFNLTLGLVICALIISPSLTILYALRWRKMLGHIAKFTERLKCQQVELDGERKRADFLLCQMLPKQVAQDIKQNKPVHPESFEEATVYFSDIDGFKDLVGNSTPFEVVDFLNQLYNQCDCILDQFDAYKVETIGDSYLIVSGVPKRNGSNHSAIMATLALTMLMSMESMVLSFDANLRIRLRIGLHTGPLVAGVMGLKNQRYCLIGDTVNTASRMMSNGLPLRIHLSSAAYQHLEKNHAGEFFTSSRGPIEIKGKGTLITHWLIGKRGFPYTVNVDNLESSNEKIIPVKESVSNNTTEDSMIVQSLE